jgi:superfamily II DNA/RNA helicase
VLAPGGYCIAPAQHCRFLSAVRLIKTIRKKNPSVQLLLFSATYNDKVKAFAMRIAPSANQVRGSTQFLNISVAFNLA